MTTPEAELRRVWRRAIGPHADDAFDRLMARHREPHRRYHTATHVMWVCRHVAELHEHHPVDDIDAVQAAALFHDAVYDPRSTTNEAASAQLAQRVLGEAGWSPERCQRAAALVLATAQHRADDLATAVLLDADLAILGGQVSEYQPYVAAVRAEYAHVDDDAWRRGRRQVLEAFLDRPAIYLTATMHTQREARARANLAAELATLADG